MIRKSIKIKKIMILAIAGSILYWAAESVGEYFLLRERDLLSYLLPSQPHEIYMRSIVVVVIILLGAAIQRSVDKTLIYNRKIRHLNRALSSIIDVNQLINRQQDPEILLPEICKIMVRDKGYYNCWIVLADESGKPTSLYQAGLKECASKLLEVLKEGRLPECIKAADKNGMAAIENPAEKCKSCFLAKNYRGRGAFCAELKRKKVYGYMVLSIPREFVSDRMERNLFEEVAGDIAFALEKIELENIEIENEKRMAQIAQKFLELFNSITDSVFIHDLEGKFLEVNDSACSRLGYSRGDFMGMNISDLDSPKFIPFIGKRMDKLKKDGSLIAESLHITSDGKEVPVEINSKIVNYEGREAVLTVARDITERKKAQEKINHLVYYDSLTDLPNRRLFNDRMQMAIADAKRNKKRFAVCMMDIDNLKDINDSLGHAAGDLLIKQAGKRIKGVVRESDTIARLGGDEFIMLVTDTADFAGIPDFRIFPLI